MDNLMRMTYYYFMEAGMDEGMEWNGMEWNGMDGNGRNPVNHYMIH